MILPDDRTPDLDEIAAAAKELGLKFQGGGSMFELIVHAGTMYYATGQPGRSAALDDLLDLEERLQTGQSLEEAWKTIGLASEQVTHRAP